MRKVVAIEKREQRGKNHVILLGALSPADVAIPVTLRINHHNQLIGFAREFQRDEKTGEISFDFSVDYDVELPNVYPHVSMFEVLHDVLDDVFTVYEATIKEIFFSNKPSRWMEAL